MFILLLLRILMIANVYKALTIIIMLRPSQHYLIYSSQNIYGKYYYISQCNDLIKRGSEKGKSFPQGQRASKQ